MTAWWRHQTPGWEQTSNLAEASTHPDGHIREAAVTKMASDPASKWIPLLLPRAADWVEPVRRHAQHALRQHLRPEWAHVFLAHSALIERLRRGSRFPASLTTEIQDLLLSPACTATLEEGLSESDVHVRRACFRLAFVRPSLLAFFLGARDRDAVIRALAFAHPDIDPQLFTLAATDPAASIRRLAFEKLGPSETFLFDPSAGLRRDAQRAFPNAAAYYRATTPAAIAVQGLGETGDSNDVPRLAPLLDHALPSVRVSAIRALHKLGAIDRYTDRLLEALADPSASVVREAAVTLLDNRLADAETVWHGSRQTPSLLRLMRKAPPWAGLRIYLECADELRLTNWFHRAGSGSGRLTPAEKARTLALLESAAPRLNAKLVRELRFAIETSHS